MSERLGKGQKKEAMRDIILKLHEGLSVEEAKERFLSEVGTVSSVEIADIEQSLINEGLSPDEIKKFCNVHALLFESALKQNVVEEESPSHPVFLFKKENREIEKIIGKTREIAEGDDQQTLSEYKNKLDELLEKLRRVDVHYTRKEAILFPYLERHGFFGPSTVMWGKDDEIRELMESAALQLQKLKDSGEIPAYRKSYLDPMLEEVEGMIFKEESILFPTSIEKLTTYDWAEVLKQSEEVGYVFIEKPKETDDLTQDLKRVLTEVPAVKDEQNVTLPTGDLSLKELTAIFNTLPVDLTFIDSEDGVKYFSDNKDRIFLRTKAVIGRKVQNCHPPASVEIVEKILESFKSGLRSSADFWINREGKLIFIRYFAVRDHEGTYLGTLEVSQDITDIQRLKGEKRIFDEGD
jgi:PAS domain S-box-containing protein